ncbi:HNH endonuclease [Dehalogenimonas alkenigignens]|uniref:HNH nuclease domain-containing protein n=1 Tax=Dehalogenimonas alkenigignens TaxID=1217799 RepID=A0A0W0GHP4_9CHLR|nr:HNH endonuclease [Dehalogenimonas alkenigignens]KTB48080.1 hypothetical protein DEALK_09250 [Dehalogenimonas alkenigignens]PVV84332.1 HNH endonuclease [Dehalogenimonas alkenigignens]
MTISTQDIKLLWGRAAQRCAFPDCQRVLSENKKTAHEGFPLGEMAHIVGESENAPRGDSNLSLVDRDSYFNLILLCPTHHTLIDKNVNDYTIEKLHLLKDQHEYWVERSLVGKKDTLETAQAVIYGNLIDSVVEACQLDTWDTWASRAAALTIRWDKDAHDRLFRFKNKIIGAIWPKTLPELECTIKMVTYELYEAVQTFALHCKPSTTKIEYMVEDVFYKTQGWLPQKEYDELFEEYKCWHTKCENHIIEATKAINWLADVVRRDINPLFYATKGKFFLILGPYGDTLEFRSYFFEYTKDQKLCNLSRCDQGQNMWLMSDNSSKPG